MARVTTSKKKAPATNRSRSPVSSQGAKAAIEPGKLDPQETVDQALALILRHPHHEQPGVLALIYGGLKKSLVDKHRDSENLLSYNSDNLQKLMKSVEEIHYSDGKNVAPHANLNR